MVLINAEEKKAISERFPNVHICRTVRQKSKRHRYYMEETKSAMRLLRHLRGLDGDSEVSHGRV